MADKEMLVKIKELADAMYYAAQQLTTDASRMHKAMDEYHKFVTHEYTKEKPVSEDLEKAARKYAGIPEDSPHDLKYCVQDKKAKYNAVLYGANWQKEQMLNKAFPVEIGRGYPDGKARLFGNFSNCNTGDKVKIVFIKESK